MTIITVRDSQGRPKLEGFKYFWTVYVRGFNPKFHCQRCLVGKHSRKLTRKAAVVGEPIQLDEARRFDALYICGVAEPFEYQNNFHLVLRPDASAEPFTATTYNGYELRIEGAAAVPIQPVTVEYQWLPAEYRTCRNFQAGAQLYGLHGLPRQEFLFS